MIMFQKLWNCSNRILSVFGLISGPVSDHFGAREAIFVDSTFWFIGLLSASYTTNYEPGMIEIYLGNNQKRPL